jgi:hypothetical protein
MVGVLFESGLELNRCCKLPGKTEMRAADGKAGVSAIYCSIFLFMQLKEA